MRCMAEKLNTSGFFFFLCFCPTRFATTLNSMKHKWKIRSCASAQVTLEVPRGLSWPFPASSCFCWFSCRWSIWPLGLELLGPLPVWSNATTILTTFLYLNYFPYKLRPTQASFVKPLSYLSLASESESLSFFSSSSLPRKNWRAATRIWTGPKEYIFIYILFSKRDILIENVPLSLWRNTLWLWH